MAGLTLNELKALAAVANHRSFRAAAIELGVSPSSLSHAVASIERRLGVRLFNRTTRSVSLTEAGEGFLARVQPALREISDAVESVNQFRKTPAGLLRLNTSEGGAERVLPLVLDFIAAFPDMRVDLVSEGRMVDIVAAGFDAGLRLAEAVPQDMVSVSLGQQEELVVVGTADYFAARGVPEVPADLFKHECIRARMPSGSIYRWEFERAGEETPRRSAGTAHCWQSWSEFAGGAKGNGAGLCHGALGACRSGVRAACPRSGRMDAGLLRPLPLLSPAASAVGRFAGVHRPRPGRAKRLNASPQSPPVPAILTALGNYAPVPGPGLSFRSLK